ncbi:hypothetical protein [Leptothoe spongobia]|uniref:Uncharacterized protein n=1 Tax=Leptothoe spongobia TAU-MAC 1115 TaxID=1967444 RepID=A0A947DCE5_9CYAN|nr:hypothetical protein [Leptothoe spongobia]MBT9314521.1 hypothetical protein [Leptothoe spongobia TAU-MAC 1115]
MKTSNSQVLNNYWGLIKNLHISWKLDLIERLTQSIRQNLSQGPNTMKNAFGAWQSAQSAEQIIQELRNSRNTNRQIEEL